MKPVNNKKHYHSWINPNLVVKKIPGMGKGVFPMVSGRKN